MNSNEKRNITMLTIGTRPSNLALAQVNEVVARFPDIAFNIRTINTAGDLDKQTPYALKEKTDFFTGTIERTLIAGEIDVAVHSAKDLEDAMPDELMIAALTRSISVHDCLVSRTGDDLDSLPHAATIGTSSKARSQAITDYRKDLRIKHIRGNVDERIAQLDAGSFDAIIVAHAALIRLRLEYRIAQHIPVTIITPHSMQGRLAIQIRKDRHDLVQSFRGLHEY